MLLSATAGVTAAAWLWLNQSHSAVLLPHCHTGTGIAGFLGVVVMWQAMSVAIMAPTTIHWLLPSTALTAGDQLGQTLRRALAFSSGYFCVWRA